MDRILEAGLGGALSVALLMVGRLLFAYSQTQYDNWRNNTHKPDSDRSDSSNEKQE